MIKQIQLRGISRTPSDRLSEDGGLSESLNMYMDTAESAPAIVPKDITAELGLPLDLQAERIFVHKTANYENYVAVVEDKIVAYTPNVIGDEEPLSILELTNGEKVNDIASVGNTLIISTDQNMYYSIYNGGEYSLLGNELPFPTVEFWDARTTMRGADKYFSYNYKLEDGNTVIYDGTVRASLIDEEKGAQVISHVEINTSYDADLKKLGTFDPDVWGSLDASGFHTNELAAKLLDGVKQVKDAMVASNAEQGYFSYPIWILYAVKLYDDSYIVSSPQMLSIGKEEPFDIYGQGLEGGASHIFVRLNHYYKIGARLHDWDEDVLKKWKDVIKGVDIFITEDINRLDFKNITVDKRQIERGGTGTGSTWITKAWGKFKISGSETSFISDALKRSTFVKVEEFFIDEDFYNNEAHALNELRSDYIFDSRLYIKDEQRFAGRSFLADQVYVMREHIVAGAKLNQYNNSILLSDWKKKYTPGPHWLLGQRYNTALPLALYMEEDDLSEIPTWIWLDEQFSVLSVGSKFSFSYHMKDSAIVHGNSLGKNEYSIIERYDDLIPTAFTLFIYPSSLCNKTKYTSNVFNNTIVLHEATMNPHPTLPNCSVYYDKSTLGDKEGKVNKGLDNEKNPICSTSLGLSEQDNPFILSKEFVFQSKVVGVAVASTALSQGQFGQFPLYVFTEDGIWVMETSADGSFTTSKPLSREVCINPDSIISIDNAVVFITAKGVMMIQGSEVMNISPYMNGKHYEPNESAKSIIRNQEGFDELEKAISDKTPFTAFMKTAKVAYDYNGQRLIFISSDSNIDFQYIYKIDTQTWHKISFEDLNIKSTLNSYPECHVLGELLGTLSPSYATQQAAYLLGMNKEVLEEHISNKDLIKFYSDKSPIFSLERLGFSIDDKGETSYKRLNIEIDGFTNTIEVVLANKAYLMDLLACNEDAFDKLLRTGHLSTIIYVAPDESKRIIADIYNFLYIIAVEESDVTCYEFIITELNDTNVSLCSRVYNFSTILDVANAQDTAKGILITRPFDLGMPDVFKSIKSIKIRGDYDKGNVRYLLQGSDNGRDFYTLNSLRGKSWKMFRIFILADLEPTERISWIDIDFEPRYNNRLR